MAKKKAYKRKPNTVTLEVEGAYEGLEIVMKSLTIKDFRRLLPIVKKAEAFDEDAAAENIEALGDLMDEVVGILTDYIVSWNMEDDDGPVPVKDIANEELPLIMAVFQGWSTSMTGVTPELGKDSTSGETILMPPMTMETL